MGGDYFRNRVAGMIVAVGRILPRRLLSLPPRLSFADSSIALPPGPQNFIGGLSLGWWTDNHNTHHLVTNHPEHDPDIQHIPFFAITTAYFSNLFSTYYNHVKVFDGFSRFMVKHQHRT